MSEVQNDTASTNGAISAAPSREAPVVAQHAAPERAMWQATPQMDVYESAGDYLIRLDVPGATPDSVDVQIEGTEVHVRARQAPAPHYHDVALTAFQRHFALPSEVDTASATAELRDGVLEVRIQKTAAARRVKIPVSAN